MKQTKRKPARRARSARSKPTPATTKPNRSTALVRQQPMPPARRAELVVESEPRALSDKILLGELGLVEVKLSEAEERVLARPVDPALVLVKPTGQPYIPHANYTRWFNEAFGRTGWSILPASKPMLSNGAVVCPYILFIHQQPVAFAMGEQEFFESNRDQSYGDALESTVASGLRRCAKRLGVGLELWDRQWLDWFLEAHCVRVAVERDGQTKYWWRRKDAPEFWGEQASRRGPKSYGPTPAGQGPANARPAAPARTPPPARTPRASDDQVITPRQWDRLMRIFENSGRSEGEVGTWLKARYGWDNSRHITRGKYDEVCAAIEASGPLPS